MPVRDDWSFQCPILKERTAQGSDSESRDILRYGLQNTPNVLEAASPYFETVPSGTSNHNVTEETLAPEDVKPEESRRLPLFKMLGLNH